MRWTQPILTAIALACLAAPALAFDPPAFGPQTFERTTGETDVYVETIASPTGGPYTLFLQNGDGESSRVASATVRLNGTAVVLPSELDEQVDGLRRAVSLESGDNELVVEINGAPGSFVTLALAHRGHVPVFVHGRLVLPWGRNDLERSLALALKNGSHRAPRAFRVVFFAPNGEVTGVSERLTLPPRGSLAAAVTELLAEGDWRGGSAEIFYAGPGVARMFGTARHLDPMTGQVEIESLEHAGARLFRAGQDLPDPRDARRR